MTTPPRIERLRMYVGTDRLRESGALAGFGRGYQVAGHSVDRGDARLRAAFICAGDPLNIRTWSGTPYHMLEALQEQFDVSLVVRRPWPKWFELCRRALRKLSRGAIDLYWSPRLSSIAAAEAISAVTASQPDVVFAIAVTPVCARLVDRANVVFVSDATQASMVNYNPYHRALAPWLKRSANALESYCVQKAALSLFPSQWAGGSAVRDHGAPPSHVAEVPWGANLVADEIKPPESRSRTDWRLLFIGTSWTGKGGDIVLKTVEEMRRRGASVSVDIVGSQPSEPPPEIEGVTFHGFLDKSSGPEGAKIRQLLSDAHVLFLPTQFDALGIVFAEAASFALPAVSYRTGGVPGMVVDGETGILLEEGAPPERFADELISLLSDQDRYVAMSNAALARSHNQLNWKAWGAQVRREVEKRLAS